MASIKKKSDITEHAHTHTHAQVRMQNPCSSGGGVNRPPPHYKSFGLCTHTPERARPTARNENSPRDGRSGLSGQTQKAAWQLPGAGGGSNGTEFQLRRRATVGLATRPWMRAECLGTTHLKWAGW